jgi:hypothetical protein
MNGLSQAKSDLLNKKLSTERGAHQHSDKSAPKLSNLGIRNGLHRKKLFKSGRSKGGSPLQKFDYYCIVVFLF